MKRSELHQVIGCLFANGEGVLAHKLACLSNDKKKALAAGHVDKYAILSDGKEIKGMNVNKDSSFYYKFSKDMEHPKGLLVINKDKKEVRVPANIVENKNDVFIKGTKIGIFVRINKCSIKELRKKYNKIRLCQVSI